MGQWFGPDEAVDEVEMDEVERPGLGGPPPREELREEKWVGSMGVLGGEGRSK